MATKVRKINPYQNDLPTKADGTTDWKTIVNIAKHHYASADQHYYKAQPNAEELEQAVLGAILTDSSIFSLVQQAFCYTPNPFYCEHNNLIYEACTNLTKRGEPIDMMTATFELRKMGKLEQARGAFYIVELCQRVASVANVEYHAKIVYQQYMRRTALSLMGRAMSNMYDDSFDVFDILNHVHSEIVRLENPSSPLRTMSMSEVMEKAARATAQSMICGDLLRVGDIAFMFAGPGTGKSILAVQIADAITKGKNLFNNILINEVGPQKVLYFDFELRYSDYKGRYIDAAGHPYQFAENYIRVGENEENGGNFEALAANAESLLARDIQNNLPDVVIIDNITSIANGATADAEVAMRIMNSLKTLKSKYNLTILVLAHTPKRNTTQAITINDMGGSSQLGNFANNIWAIGSSKMDKSIKYIKQVKARGAVERFDADCVLQVAVEKFGAFLQMTALEEPFGKESDHLTDFNQETEEDVLKMALDLQNQGKGLRSIVAELGLKMSHAQLGIKLNKLKASIIEPEFTEGVNIEVMPIVMPIAPNFGKTDDLPF